MNRSPARSIALALLLALHGIAILCGTAMHRQEWLTSPKRVSVGSGSAPTAQVDSSHDDCPICHFFAQAQLGNVRVEIGSFESMAIGNPSLGYRDIPSSQVRAPRSRAPPRT